MQEDEMSLVMLINKMQQAADISDFLRIPQERINQIIQKTPEHILQIIAATIWSLCMKMNVPEEDILQCVEKVKERRMGYFFENFEKFDIQELWRERDKVKKELTEAKEELTETKEELTETKDKMALSIIVLCRQFGLSKADTAARLQADCDLTKAEAELFLERHWKE